MKRQKILSLATAVLLLLLASLAGCSYPATETGKPNIILILADDLGYEGLSCNGGEDYKTPRLDALSQPFAVQELPIRVDQLSILG